MTAVLLQPEIPLRERVRAARKAFKTGDHGTHWNVRATVEKWNPATIDEIVRFLGYEPDQSVEIRALAHPDRLVEAEFNKLINAGMIVIYNYMMGTSGYTTQFTNTTSRLGVGDGGGSVPSEANADVGLVASSGNRYFAGMQASYPSVTGTAPPQWNFQAQFASGNGNFAWNEWSVDNATTAGTSLPGNTATAAATNGISALNHRGVGLGTKVSGAVWTLTINITVT